MIKIIILNIMKLSWVIACFFFPLNKLIDQFLSFILGLHEDNKTTNLGTIYPDLAYGHKTLSEASNRAILMFYN